LGYLWVHKRLLCWVHSYPQKSVIPLKKKTSFFCAEQRVIIRHDGIPIYQPVLIGDFPMGFSTLFGWWFQKLLAMQQAPIFWRYLPYVRSIF
jgi:hypothetical protein